MFRCTKGWLDTDVASFAFNKSYIISFCPRKKKKTDIFLAGKIHHEWVDVDVSENSGFSPQIIHFNKVFHYFHHPFWGVFPYFWSSTHVFSYWKLGGFSISFQPSGGERCSVMKVSYVHLSLAKVDYRSWCWARHLYWEETQHISKKKQTAQW